MHSETILTLLSAFAEGNVIPIQWLKCQQAKQRGIHLGQMTFACLPLFGCFLKCSQPLLCSPWHLLQSLKNIHRPSCRYFSNKNLQNFECHKRNCIAAMHGVLHWSTGLIRDGVWCPWTYFDTGLKNAITFYVTHQVLEIFPVLVFSVFKPCFGS